MIIGERTPVLSPDHGGEGNRLVILGTGFAAFSLIKAINPRRYAVTVISPRNHFLFTPLLPSTTVGTIEFRSIIEPIRAAAPKVRYIQARCSRIDAAGRRVDCVQDSHAFSLSFDRLVIAVGSANNTFGIPGVEEFALFLKELSDARAIRGRIIDCFERAETPGIDAAERRRLLHIVVVGGGPTGVEFAAEMHDFLDEDLRKPFRNLIGEVRITLLEAGDQILSSFDAALGAYALKQFRRQGIEVRTGSSVVSIDSGAIRLSDGESIPYGLLVWSTGIGPIPFVESLPFGKDPRGRLLVDEFLRIPGVGEIYALGDCATTEGMNLPATSQVAQQEGSYLGRALNHPSRARPFRYKHLGMLAYIGRNEALADLASVKGRGVTTWLFWRSVYLTKLVSFKNKVLVVFDWFKTFLFGRDISRF